MSDGQSLNDCVYNMELSNSNMGSEDDGDIIYIESTECQNLELPERKPSINELSNSRSTQSRTFPKWGFYKEDKRFLIVYDTEDLCRPFRRLSDRNTYSCHRCKGSNGIYAHFKSITPDPVPRDFPALKDHQCEPMTLAECHIYFNTLMKRQNVTPRTKRRLLSPTENHRRKILKLDSDSKSPNSNPESQFRSSLRKSHRVPSPRLPSPEIPKKTIIQNKDILIMIRDHSDDSLYRKFIRFGNSIFCSCCGMNVKLEFHPDGSSEIVGQHFPDCKLFKLDNDNVEVNNTTKRNQSCINECNQDKKKGETDFETKEKSLYVNGRIYDDCSKDDSTKMYFCRECLKNRQVVEAKVVQSVIEEEHCEACKSSQRVVEKVEESFQKEITSKAVQWGENIIHEYKNTTESCGRSEISGSDSDSEESSEDDIDNEKKKVHNPVPQVIKIKQIEKPRKDWLKRALQKLGLKEEYAEQSPLLFEPYKSYDLKENDEDLDIKCFHEADIFIPIFDINENSEFKSISYLLTGDIKHDFEIKEVITNMLKEKISEQISESEKSVLYIQSLTELLKVNIIVYEDNREKSVNPDLTGKLTPYISKYFQKHTPESSFDRNWQNKEIPSLFLKKINNIFYPIVSIKTK